MFAQAGLLDPNHPAINYRLEPVEGKVSTREIIGEAWYNLRTGEGVTPYQYGMFASLIMFFVMCTAGLMLFLAYFALNLGQVAHAQIFHLPAGNTDWTTANMGGPTPTNLMEFRRACDPPFVAPPNCSTASGDLAIMFLDRVLRQGADPGTGGAMQNGLQVLLGTYSSGVLIVAAFITSWAIFSVVTDTMRTGHLGGGRHNMLWAPIRFVFALGLLVPIGGGYNAGQILVMKLAEWGSNLGSNGWRDYLATVAVDSLVANLESQNVSWAVRDWGRISTCIAAYNSYQVANAGVSATPVNAQSDKLWVRRVDNYTTNPYNLTRYYGNELNVDMCGSMSIPLWDEPSLASGDPADVFKRSMRQAFLNGFQAMVEPGLKMGCAIASEIIEPGAFPGDTCPGVERVESTTTFANVGDATARIPIGSSGNRGALDLPAGAIPLGDCGDGGANSGAPKADNSCVVQMLDDWNAVVLPAMAAAQAQLINDMDNPGTPYDRMTRQGWAAMGIFYSEISRLNRQMQEASKPELSFNTKGSLEADKYANCDWWDVLGSLFGEPSCVPDEHAEQVKIALATYDTWWDNEPALSGTVRLAANAPGSPGEATVLENGEVGDDFDFRDIVDGGVTSMLKLFFGANDSGFFLYKLANYSAAANPPYPMAQIAHIGETMYERSMYAYGGILTAGLIGGAFGKPWELTPGFGGGAMALLMGPVGDIIMLLAQAMFVPGVMLMFYVPLIPWVRVTFAAIGWIMTVFEAAAMIPIYALAHLRTDGPGLMGQQAATAWTLLFKLLVHPILIVIGYVGAILIFNASAQYVGDTMMQAIPSAQAGSGMGVMDRIFNTIIYVGLIYTLANSIFKLVDIVPAAVTNWAGFQGASRSAGGYNPMGGADPSGTLMAAAGGEASQHLRSKVQSFAGTGMAAVGYGSKRAAQRLMRKATGKKQVSSGDRKLLSKQERERILSDGAGKGKGRGAQMSLKEREAVLDQIEDLLWDLKQRRSYGLLASGEEANIRDQIADRLQLLGITHGGTWYS